MYLSETIDDPSQGYPKLLMIVADVRLRGAQALGKLNRVLINNSKGVRPKA